MKRLFPALLLALCLPATAEQVLNLAGGGQAADLRCPAVAAKPKVAPAAARPTEDELVLPEREDLEDILAGKTNAHLASGFERPQAAPGRPLAIAFWGDSHLAAGFFAEELVRLSGFAKDEAQPTFIPAGIGRGGVRLPLRKHCVGGGWQYKFAYFRQPQAGAAFSPGLSQLRSIGDNAYLWVDFRQQADLPALKSVDLLFAPGNAGVPPVIGISVDDGDEQLLTLDSPDGILRIVAEQSLSVLRLRVAEGNVVFEGMRPQYLSPPALRLDTLAIPGSTVRGWANVDPAYLKSRLGDVDYDFIALEYGTNEGNQKPFDANAYAQDLRNALGNLRQAFPSARCMLIGPTDRGILVRSNKTKKKGKKRQPPPPKADLLHYARIHREIGNIQRLVGQEFHCGFWSWQDAMGGPGGAYRWLYGTPRLMAKDLIHLTVPGYQQSARSFADDVRFTEWFALPAR